jgi:plastocyanin
MRRLTLLTAALACLLASCGGGSDEKKAAPTATTTVAKGLKVSAKEYSFNPSNVVVKGGGGKLKITLTNDGSIAHDLKVEKNGQEIGGTPTFAGGQTQSATVKLAPGSYTFLCTVGDHADLGMRGKLTVER